MHKGRGRIRTSSQVFPQKDVVTRLVKKFNKTDDLRGALLQARGFETHTRNSIPSETEKEILKTKMATKSSECFSLPTEQAPNFGGWQNMEVNADHSLSKDAKHKKRNTIKNKMTSVAATAKTNRDPFLTFSQSYLKEVG